MRSVSDMWGETVVCRLLTQPRLDGNVGLPSQPGLDRRGHERFELFILFTAYRGALISVIPGCSRQAGWAGLSRGWDWKWEVGG